MKTSTKIYIASLGGSIEFFDFTLFVFLSSTLAKAIYPHMENSSIGIIAVLSSVVASYIVRPLGGIIFGHIGDKHGRKKAFLVTITIISISMFLIACIPPFPIGGVFSPLTLLILRIIQGVAFGGDIGTIVPYVIELSEKNKRTLAGGKLAASILTGPLVASLLVLLLNTLISTQDMVEYGWRVAFIIAGLVGLVAIPLRINLSESHEFDAIRSMKRIRPLPLSHLLKNNLGTTIKVTLVSLPAIFNYTYVFVLLPLHLKKFSNLSQKSISTGSVVGNITILASILFFSTMADKVGIRKVIKLGLLAFLFIGTPTIISLFYISGNIVTVSLIYAVLALVAGMLSGCCYTYIGESFPVETRCSAVAFVINVSVLCSGILFPFFTIGASYIRATPAVFLMLIAIVAFFTTTRQKTMISIKS